MFHRNLLTSNCLLFSVLCAAATAQVPDSEYWKYMRTITPEGYVCYRAQGAVAIDGRLDDPAWKAAPWTGYFVDIEGAKRPGPRFKTRAKMLWDDRNFYFAVEMEEPHVWGTILFRDQVVCSENDFEIFIDPNSDNHQYYEMEFSPTNILWDLFLRQPYKDGGGNTASADHTWNVNGIRHAVWVDGTLNYPYDTDRSWSLEVAVPWTELAPYAHKSSPPKHGDVWRVNFSRVEWIHEVVTSDRTTPDITNNAYRLKPETTCDNWVWSPHGIINMHTPEMFGYVQFSTARPGADSYRSDPTLEARRILHDIYYAQRDYRDKNKRWASGLKDLGLDFSGNRALGGEPVIESTADGWIARLTARLPGGKMKKISIRQDSKVEEE
ncbi:MAG: carbohydrate-binding family 9-like protein [Candidatus Latescibacterota bacterium]